MANTTATAGTCIEFCHLGKTFSPEFTHQIFDGEVIPGYKTSIDKGKPSVSSSSEQSCTNTDLVVASNADCIKIQVSLSPSCETCRVQLSIETVPEGDKYQADESRKRKLEESENEKPTKKVCFNMSDTSNAPPSADASAPLEKIQPKEILERLGPALPPMDALVFIDGKKSLEKDNRCTKSDVAQGYLTTPIGTKLREYQQGDDVFILCLATPDEVVKSYHNQIQKLALWFIETADGVDLGNTDGGSWKVLYLLRQHKLDNKEDARYSLAGYTTLYSFYSPFRKPQPGHVMRICQVIILPPYQRKGHGRKLLEAVYDFAHEKLCAREEGQESIREINVEDPAPGFTALRNSLDYQFLFRARWHQCDGSIETNSLFANEKENSFAVPDRYLSEECFENIQERDVQEISIKSKLTRRQVQIAYEIFKLQQRNARLMKVNNLGEGNQEKIDAIQKQYRLMVKRRLNQTHKEDLGACKNKQEKKEKLEELFQEALEQYQRIVGK